MSYRGMLIGFLVLAFAGPALSPAQAGGSVSYRLDGKDFSFKNGRLEHYRADGYVSLVAERAEMVENPSGPEGEKREVTVGMTIQLAKAESEFVGEHRSAPGRDADAFLVVRDRPDRGQKEPDDQGVSGQPGRWGRNEDVIRLKIDAFGPAGGLVTGTFSGRLTDEDGRLHEITGGVFSVPRVDMK